MIRLFPPSLKIPVSGRVPLASALRTTFILALLVTPAAAEDDRPKPTLGMPNPAAVLCIKNGARMEVKAEASGAERGICVFPNGERIDEWAYFRNKHRTH